MIKRYITLVHILIAVGLLVIGGLLSTVRVCDLTQGVLLGGVIFLVSYATKEAIGKGDC